MGRNGAGKSTTLKTLMGPVIVEQMADMVLKLKQQGVSILLSEQNLHFAEQVCDRAYVLEQGLLRHHAPMAELMADQAIRRNHLEM